MPWISFQWHNRRNAVKSSMKLPKGPQTPALLQTLQFIFNPMSWMEACAQRYGDIFTVKQEQPEVWVSNPEALQQILASDN